jgi:hypothetical protein
MRRSLILLAVMPLFACAQETEDAETAAATAAPVGAPVSCITLDQVISRRPAGAQAVEFELTGGRRYRNEIVGACPGLERAGSADIVHVEATGSQLCRDDRVRIYDPVEARNTGAQSFPHCRLGMFTPIAAR